MKKQIIFFISILMLVVACKSYAPFNSKKEKKAQLKLIEHKFSLNDFEVKKIKNEDSILFAVSKSLKNNIKSSLIERRLDSFFLNNYNREDLLIMLLIDYNFPHKKRAFEFNRKENASGIEFKNIEEMKKFFTPGGQFDKDVEKMLGMKKKDSTRQKKKNQ